VTTRPVASVSEDSPHQGSSRGLVASKARLSALERSVSAAIGREPEYGRSARYRPDRSLLRFPRRFDDVAVGITARDADVGGFVPLLDQLEPIARNAVAQLENGVTVGQRDAEVHLRRPGDPLGAGIEGEREARVVVQHQHAVVIPSRRARAKAEISLVEAARALLVAYRDCEVIHNRDGTTSTWRPLSARANGAT
jgi:hypothetical protein